jgi:PAS domain S-box-containing protein
MGANSLIQADPHPLTHSWPLFDASARMALANLAFSGTLAPEWTQNATAPGIGLWSCNLADNALTWSSAVYELFGIPTGEALTRDLTVSFYGKPSRDAMESMRKHAIRHRRGFTMDALLRRPDGEKRWMRLTAMPILVDRKVARLCGIKQDVTAEYDGYGWQKPQALSAG